MACLVLACARLAQLYLIIHSENTQLRDKQTLGTLELRGVRNQLQAERIINSRKLADANRQISEVEQTEKTHGDLAKLAIYTLTPASSTSSHGLAVIVWNPAKQEGALWVENLPAPASGQDYQLWITGPGYPKPVDSGVFTVDSQTGTTRVNFRPCHPVVGATKFAICLKHKGDVTSEAGPIVLESR